jgi:translocating chain-associated membrane protein 1
MTSGIRKRPGSAKAAPYFSHEFIIQNHGDIATCACMVFIIGLMFQVTTPLASTFIVPKYNLTELETATARNPVLYTYGLKDLCLLLFYTITCVIFHAIIQEYVLDVSWPRNLFSLFIIKKKLKKNVRYLSEMDP